MLIPTRNVLVVSWRIERTILLVKALQANTRAPCYNHSFIIVPFFHATKFNLHTLFGRCRIDTINRSTLTDTASPITDWLTSPAEWIRLCRLFYMETQAHPDKDTMSQGRRGSSSSGDYKWRIELPENRYSVSLRMRDHRDVRVRWDA